MPYQPHPSAGELPGMQTPIWRFLSLVKFLSLLTSSSLYFAQVLQLKKLDAFEGSLALPNRQFRELMIADEEFARQFMKIPSDHPLPPNHQQFWHPDAAKAMQEIFSSTTYVNCWHMSSNESAFLWSSYASLTDGVALRSTIGNLCESVLSEPRAIYIGPVRYIDYTTDVIAEDNAFNPFFCKRKSFEPEQELRACFSHLVDGIGWSPGSLASNPKGISVRCDIKALIGEVLVSPFAPDWCVDVIGNVCRTLGQNLRITKSSISNPAIL